MLHRFIATAAVLAGLAAVACGGGGDRGDPRVEGNDGSPVRRSSEEIAADNVVRAAPTPFVAEPTPVVVAEIPTPDGAIQPDDFTIPLGDDYDPELNMYRYISGGFHSTELTVLALASAVENNDRSQVAVIIEGMRIMQPATAQLSTIALTRLTGQDFGPGLAAWDEWMEWYGLNGADFPPSAGYIDWKVNLLGQIDPAFADFLMPWAFTGRVDPTEIVWGGVKKDGIPDLQNPPLLTPEEAEAAYILPDDRLFGVSINGQHRAYPLRIINAHEMANDVLGGEPIALAY